MWDDHLVDQIFLESCLQEDQRALDRWQIDSYEREVAQTVKTVLQRFLPGPVDRDLLEALIADCTSAIYEEYAEIPRCFYKLKTRIRGYAFAYTKRYVETLARKLSRDP